MIAIHHQYDWMRVGSLCFYYLGLGIKHFCKLFEQIINKHSGGDKTINTCETGQWTHKKYTHTYSQPTRHDTTRHGTACIQFTLFHTHTHPYKNKQTIKHNILAYVIPTACWSAELSAFFLLLQCRPSCRLHLWSDQQNSWINKQSFSIYMTNRFRFWLTSAHKQTEIQMQKHAVNIYTCACAHTAGLNLVCEFCERVVVECDMRGEVCFKNEM